LSGGFGRGGGETGGGIGSDFNKNNRINNSKRLKGEAARWILAVSDSSDRPTVLCDGDMVEYQAEYDDRKGKYRDIEVTGGRKKEEDVEAVANTIVVEAVVVATDTVRPNRLHRRWWRRRLRRRQGGFRYNDRDGGDTRRHSHGHRRNLNRSPWL
jgi:hypothetical protein